MKKGRLTLVAVLGLAAALVVAGLAVVFAPTIHSHFGEKEKPAMTETEIWRAREKARREKIIRERRKLLNEGHQ